MTYNVFGGTLNLAQLSGDVKKFYSVELLGDVWGATQKDTPLPVWGCLHKIF